jgi:hypothetical protein
MNTPLFTENKVNRNSYSKTAPSNPSPTNPTAQAPTKKRRNVTRSAAFFTNKSDPNDPNRQNGISSSKS